MSGQRPADACQASFRGFAQRWLPKKKRRSGGFGGGSPKEPKNEQQAAGHSQSSRSIRGNCARVSRNRLSNKDGAVTLLHQVYGGGAVPLSRLEFKTASAARGHVNARAPHGPGDPDGLGAYHTWASNAAGHWDVARNVGT